MLARYKELAGNSSNRPYAHRLREAPIRGDILYLSINHFNYTIALPGIIFSFLFLSEQGKHGKAARCSFELWVSAELYPATLRIYTSSKGRGKDGESAEARARV